MSLEMSQAKAEFILFTWPLNSGGMPLRTNRLTNSNGNEFN
jgi:hypothetical protein